MSARTARRRRKQMVQCYNHLAHLGRPVYPKPKTKEHIARREARFSDLRKRGVIK